MAGDDWTDAQNNLIVADHFAMLADDLAGRPYNKAAHNRTLQMALGRPRGAIEFKHQNVSAVLQGMGETWLTGYLPRFNFQTSLEDAVARWLAAHPGWLTRLPTAATGDANGVTEPEPLWIGPPPAQRNAPPPAELELMTSVAQRFDVAARDARNRALGRAGEACVFAHERATLVSAGRTDLAREVRWISDEEGDGAGYDIASFTPTGNERLIEVKTTNGWERTPFHISRNELAVAEARREDWRLVRLWNFARAPRAFEIRPPLHEHVALTPMSFQASLL
jgi:hypothetical protein